MTNPPSETNVRSTNPVRVIALAAALLIVSCGSTTAARSTLPPDDPATTTTAPPVATTETHSTTTSSLPPTTTSAPPATTTSTLPATTTTSTTAQPDEPVEWVLDPAAESLPAAWRSAFTIGYGEAESLLGSASGGEGLTLGPNYGAQAPDGTWWLLDGAKARVAHYDRAGAYLDAVVLPEEFLRSGVYFQYQLPRVLADGTLVAARFDEDTTDFLTVTDGRPHLASLAGTLLPRTDDGRAVYGFDRDGGLWSVEVATAESQRSDWFISQTGARYMVGLITGAVVVELPDVGVEKTISLTASNGPGAVHASLEVAIGSDGTVHMLLLGISESDESVQLAGYASIAANGTVGTMEPMINPFTPADPGSPSHMGIAYGSYSPWLMIVGVEGVDVYVRE